MNKTLSIIAAIFAVAAVSCSDGNNKSGGPITDQSPTNTPLSITDASQFIGGPLAQGQIGDILLSNNKVRAIIQQPSKFAQSCPFGGGIIDADIVRDSGEAGQDNFGKMCPLVNIEWTVNYYDFQVLSDGTAGTAQVLRAVGTIDALDYLDLDFIAPVAKALAGQSMYFSPRYDDANDPFGTYDDLRGVNIEVVTDYTLEPNSNVIRMDTTYENTGDVEASMPVGRFLNGSGQVQFLVPGLGFTPTLTAQIIGDLPAAIYVPFDGVDVSYGYFYDVRQYASEAPEEVKSAVKAQTILAGGKATSTDVVRRISTSLTYSGVTGVLFGEEFLKVVPLGGPGDIQVFFKIPPHDKRVVTEHFVIGAGNPAEVFDSGLAAIKIPTHRISGKVLDAAGAPVKDANVVVQNANKLTIITYRTGADGLFSGSLSTGEDSFAQAFGSGKYKIFVDKTGYHKQGTNIAGTCTPEDVDVSVIDVKDIVCVLGDSATVKVEGGVTDADTKSKIPARLTIVGFDPSPDSHAGAANATTHGAGSFEDTWIFERPWGIIDVKYVNVKGGMGLGDDNSFKLEPGHYAFVFSRGVEYGMEVRELDVAAGGTVVLDNVVLKRVVKTPGWISSDFHLHSIYSPDSMMLTERRALTSAGEGMDILQSSDHDWVVDYAPVVSALESQGILSSGLLGTIMGDEISPNHYGHIQAFPLECDKTKIDCGALDWTYSPLDKADPSPDLVMSPQDVIDHFKSGKGGAGEKVLQVNHIADQATSLLIISGWVTTPLYQGVSALSSYVEPSAQRILPIVTTPAIPLPFGSSPIVVADFTAVELTIGGELYTNALRETGLPQWFNFLNLGISATATGDSDSHRETVDQLGIPRNFIASDVDPKDGRSSFSELDKDAYAKAINEHKVVVSAGPFISLKAKSDDGSEAGVGGLVTGKNVTLHVEINSPSWAWFDTVEIYQNTEPVPADDDGTSMFKGVASDPKSFFAPYHVPKFYYEPSQVFATSDGSLKDWKDENGAISATIDVPIQAEEDTWVVVFVYGNKGSAEWRSMFPFVTKSVADPTKMKKPKEGWTFSSLVHDSRMMTSAWGFANPIYIDVDGDTNGDGNPFEAKYIRSGVSPLAK